MLTGFVALYIFMLAAFTGYEIIGRREKASKTGSAVLYMRKRLARAEVEQPQPDVAEVADTASKAQLAVR